MWVGVRYTMLTLINLPHEVQYHISNYLRPHTGSGGDEAGGEVKIDPIAKARDIASIKAVHSNFKAVPLWKNHEWKERIRQWCDEHLTKMRWVYQYGTLSEKMIQKDWESKINHIYGHQGCYVKTMIGTSVGTGFSEVEREYKVIWFKVCLKDLITGIRPLPHCFGSVPKEYAGSLGTFRMDQHFVPAPSLKTMIPKWERRKWLLQCFTECVVEHWGGEIVKKNGGEVEKLDFMKEFKKLMELPSDYDLTQGQLFRMFLKELRVRADYSDPDRRDAGGSARSGDRP